ncbi:MAG TPA: hypothetical protein VD886_10060 [Herpetosiphonaceae bacterium]|nr:hypothetical protein [Herpetosiphonaceae bacterium]
MRKRFWQVLMAAALGLTPVAAWACSCAQPATAAAALDASAAVFFGTVLTIVPLDGRYPVEHEQPVAVTLAVRESWKGPQTSTITLYTVINAISCEGYFWETGASFLVFARRDPDGRLGVGLCSRTVEAAGAAADLQALGPGRIPPPAPAAPPPVAATPQDAPFPWLLLGLGGAVGLIAAILVWRRGWAGRGRD